MSNRPRYKCYHCGYETKHFVDWVYHKCDKLKGEGKKMNENIKLTFAGLWVTLLVVVSLWLLSLFQDTEYYQLAILLWSFTFLGGIQFSTYCSWTKEYRDKKKVTRSHKKQEKTESKPTPEVMKEEEPEKQPEKKEE